jgi:transcriptional regulator with XRE-family HTH domain
MTRGALTGSRIRDRRVASGLKQADVARAAGISASYLNLIEHNRRRIGGKVLGDIARALGCEVTALSEGAEAVLLASLREAAVAGGAEPDKAEEFAGRFPGWAGLLVERHERVEHLALEVEALSDRLAHDPHLSASLHELLSAITAIRATTSILAGTDDLDPNWARRFLGNLDAEGRLLAEGAEALVRYLDGPGAAETTAATPQEEVEALFAARGWHLAEIEEGASPEWFVARAGELQTATGRALAYAAVDRYARDARRLPLAALAPHLEDPPGALADRFGVAPDTVLRRLALLPGREAGLVIADGAGAITFRRPLAGFPLPRHGAGCGLWPLYQALTRPAHPLRAVLEMPGEAPRRVRAEAVALPKGGAEFGAVSVFETTMLLTPTGEGPGAPVGPTCRICPREACAARREPTILG